MRRWLGGRSLGRSGRWFSGGAWALPLVLAALAVACSSGGNAFDGGSSTDDQPVTVPSSRPSPGGPTTSLVESDSQLFERTPVLPEDLLDYSNELPEHVTVLAPLDDTPSDNPGTDAGATLGRVLFYDVNLSSTRSLACASCHLQSNSFTDRTPQSLGNFGQTTRRNSMSLANLAFNANGRFFWDERAGSLEAQAVDPFSDSIELAIPPEEVVERVLSLPYYKPIFIGAFGTGAYSTDGVTMDRVAQALAQFMRAMVSVDAPYDEGRSQVASPLEAFPNFSEQENLGKLLFMTSAASGGGGCSGCHTTDLFLTPPTNGGTNGLEDGSLSLDLGVFEITRDRANLGSFRVSSLRNIEVTGPYMHDGRLRTLRDVVDHYSDNIAPHPNLGALLQDADGGPIVFSFTEEEKTALVAFLETLTDNDFLDDPRFSDPFR